MSAQRFHPGARIRWRSDARNGTYEIKRLLPDGHARIEDILMETEEAVTVTEMVAALFAGDLQFVLTGRQVKGKHGTDQGVDVVYPTLDDCPEPLTAVARFRLECIEPMLKETRPTRQEVRDRVDDIKARLREGDDDGAVKRRVSVASLYRWRADYVRSGCDLRSLIPATLKRGGKGIPRVEADVNTALEAVIREKYLVREQVTIDSIRSEVGQRIVEMRPVDTTSDAPRERGPIPSRSTIKRRIEMLDMEEVLRAKRGDAAAKRALTQYGVSDAPTMPLERVEIDHTRSDLIVLDDADNLPLGRLTLTYCLDVATRYPLGYYLGFEPPSYLAVMECLHHAIWPKRSVREAYGTEHEWVAYGVPSTLVIDNGREFIGPSLRDACLLLGTTLQRTPVKSPHFKGAAERALGSANTMLLHTLPGTTFSNTQSRGDYDAEKQACVYLSEIDKILTLFFVDIYAERYHRGLHGIPARRWERAAQSGFIPRVPSSAEELELFLGRVDHRTIHHYGIEFENLIYNSPDLVALRTRLRGARTKIKFHPGNLGRLHVHDAHDNRYIEVPALDQEYAGGLSLWKHRIIVAAARAAEGKTDLAALGRARRKIQQVVDAGRARRRGGTRSRGARWDTGGAPTRNLGAKGTAAGAASASLPDDTGAAIPAPEAAPFVLPSPASMDALAAIVDGAAKAGDLEGWGLDETIRLKDLRRPNEIQETKGATHERS
jgi:putative transposase